jgi:hypothetical protein
MPASPVPCPPIQADHWSDSVRANWNRIGWYRLANLGHQLRTLMANLILGTTFSEAAPGDRSRVTLISMSPDGSPRA